MKNFNSLAGLAFFACLAVTLLVAIQFGPGLNPEFILATLPLAGTMLRKPLEELDFQDQVLGGVNHLSSRMRSLESDMRNIKTNIGSGSRTSRYESSDIARKNFRALIYKNLRIDQDFGHLPQVQKVLGAGSLPGSNLVTDELSQVVYDTLLEYGQFRSLGVVPMGTTISKLLVPSARPKGGFIEGGQPIPKDTEMAIDRPELEAKKFAVRVDCELELLQDAAIPFDVLIFDQMIQALAEGIDYAVFRGDGTDDAQNGEITGVFEGGTVVTAAAGHASIQSLEFLDFLTVLSSVDPVVLSRNARWWMHHSMLPYVLGVRDEEGRPIFLPSTAAPSLGGLGTILGYPVTLVGTAPSENGASRKVCAFGDPQAYAVGLRQDFSFDASDHFLWNSYSRCFRALMRFDGVFRKNTGIAVLCTAAS